MVHTCGMAWSDVSKGSVTTVPRSLTPSQSRMAMTTPARAQPREMSPCFTLRPVVEVPDAIDQLFASTVSWMAGMMRSPYSSIVWSLSSCCR